MRTLIVGLLTVVIVVGTVCVGRAGAADGAGFIHEYIMDPSVVVTEPSQPAGPAGAIPRSTAGIVIQPIFDASITGDPNGATIMNTINAAIAFYESNITDQITVEIKFKKASGGFLGRSMTQISCTTLPACTVSYTSYLAALTAHATSADDATALAHLPAGPNNPANSNVNMQFTLPNLRAVGFTADRPAGHPDSTISLNIASIAAGNYDLMAVVEHEMDEVLGLGSTLRQGQGNPADPVFPEDLFRYDQLGMHSLSTASTSQAFFSLDGTTQLARFNQCASGDFGDWFSQNGTCGGPASPARVQDAFATPGATPSLGVELTALDVIGYTFGSATPPSQDDDTGFVPPDTVSKTCEVKVAKKLSTLESCIETCHITAATKAFKGKTFDEEACEGSCQTRYTNSLTGLTCPGCIGFPQQTTLGSQVETNLDSGNGALYCAGSVPFGGDDTGFVPPDPNTFTCETAVAKNVKKLNSCIRRCHITAAVKAFNAKRFDDDGCEVSCRWAYEKKQAKITFVPPLPFMPLCSGCLDAAHQTTLADQAETDLDSGNSSLFCAGTVPYPPPY
jgi:hypothetical protein